MAKQVTMMFWDVQHGHATYVKSPNNKHIVVDLGIGSSDDKDEKFSPLLHLRDKWRVKQLDYVIITHPHLDHIDDILNFDALKPKVLLRPKHLTNEEVMAGKENAKDIEKQKFKKYCEINRRYNKSVSSDSDNNPNNPDNYGGLKIKTFVPSSCNHNNFNNHSIVTVFEYEGIKVVIPGDNEKCSFDELLQKQSFRTAIADAYILLAPHHGRENGYHKEFIELVNPRLTIVSDSYFKDTSANPRYTAKSQGWSVYKKSQDKWIDRKCLTTNSDAEILVQFGIDDDKEPFLYVQLK
jgi:beta-lactamase superfamily II metal-dependent hydrolase